MTELARGGVAGVGLELAATPPSISQPSAVVVAGVVDGSPADRAGVMTGDLLTAVNGNEVRETPAHENATLSRGLIRPFHSLYFIIGLSDFCSTHISLRISRGHKRLTGSVVQIDS